jgi:hypothetical protein
MADFNIAAYYKNLRRTFTLGKHPPRKVANKVNDYSEFLGPPLGTAGVFLKSNTQVFNVMGSNHATYNRMARLVDYNEMEATAEIASALDIYAHEACAKGEYGEILTINSEDPKIKDALEYLFNVTLNIEFNAAPWFRSLCKNGDLFVLLDHHPNYGIIGAYPIPINEIEREEGFDPKNPTGYRFRWIGQSNKVLQPWEVIHFRLLGNDNFLPYGMSVLEPARRAWRQLLLMEDAVMVYRIVRSPERRVFYVDVGNVAPNDVPQAIENIKNTVKRSHIIDSNTGQVDLRYNALSVENDFFLPVRGSETGTRIDTLPGGQFTGDIDDLQYIQNKLFAALKVPKSYLGYEDALSGKSTLCIASNTKIPLLDGRTLTLDELIQEYKENKVNYAYSVDVNTKRVIHGKITWAGITIKNAKVMRIWLDNNEYVDCTPNHEIITRNGIKKQAHELNVGDSLMPLYRRLGIRDYEEVYHPGEDKWEYTHRAVALSSNRYIQGKVIHHVDANKYNNNPENLDCSMTWMEHRNFHRKHVKQTLMRPDVIEKRQQDYKDPNSNWSKWIKSEEHRKQSSEHMKKQTTDPSESLYKWIHSDGIKEAMSNIMKDRWKDPKYAVLKKQQSSEVWNRPGYREERSGDNHYIAKKYKDYDFNWLVSFCKENNITTQRELDKKAPFGLSYLESLLKKNNTTWRDFKKQHLFYNHKIIKIEYLEESTDVGCLTINNEFHNFCTSSGVCVGNSQEDVRFARTIQHIQRTFIAELEKIAMIHLYSMGLKDNDYRNFTIKMANPSTINEIQRLELWRTKFEVASMATSQDGVLDRTFIYRHIFKMSDTQIEEIEEGRKKDKLFQLQLDGMQGPAMDMGMGAMGGGLGGAPGLGGADLTGAGLGAGVGGTPVVGEPGSVTANPSAPMDANVPSQEGRDPNQQRAIPNELKGKIKKTKPFDRTDSAIANVYRTKKNGLDPKKELDLFRRHGTAPWGEQKKTSEEQMFNKRLDLLERHSEIIKILDKMPISEKKKKVL